MSEQIETRNRYKHFLTIPTRWMDNDVYGHVNNVVYYSYFDTVVNEYLVRAGGLDFARDRIVGIVVETMCRYHQSIAFPDTIDAGLRVAKIGNSSVRYEIGIFRNGEDEAAASGHFVHVFIERGVQKPTPIPERIRAALERIVLAPN
jgi:acyl-CoA thioester hydrolase